MTSGRAASRSSTRRSLLRDCIMLLVGTAIVFGSCFWSFRSVHATAAGVRDRTAPAILELSMAQAALVEANRAAIDSLSSNAIMLAGPGQEFQSQIALAGQNLTQAAEHDMAGDQGRKRLRLVEGMLTSYSGSIGRADVHYRSQHALLGAADLWYSSRLLHNEILPQLASLRADQLRELREGVAGSFSRTMVIALFGLVPPVLLFFLLCRTQVSFSRRFRRTLNPALLLALILVASLFFLMFQSLLAQGKLADSVWRFDQVVRDWDIRTGVMDFHGRQALEELILTECGGTNECGPTVLRFSNTLNEPSSSENVADRRQLSEHGSESSQQLVRAAENGRLEMFIPLIAGGTIGMILLGFRPRFDEYRYRLR